MSHSLVRLVIGSVLGALLLSTIVSSHAAQPSSAPAARAPVLVELFTSEGCSSCPPADDVLATLVAGQPVAGADVIALGFHVDYWDQHGWVDRFSSHAYTERQNYYAAAWREAHIYTPQMVVDGATQFIGSDARAARQAITAAAGSAKVPVRLRHAEGARHRRQTAYRSRSRSAASPGASAKAEVCVAMTEDGLVSDVRRGENANHRLAHAPSFAHSSASARWRSRRASRRRATSRSIALAARRAQGHRPRAGSRSRRVLGAAVQPLS